MTDQPLGLSRNGTALARVTGWRKARMVLSQAVGLERCLVLARPGASLVAVMRYRPQGAVLYGPPDAWGRRAILVRRGTLHEVIRFGLAWADQHGGAS